MDRSDITAKKQQRPVEVIEITRFLALYCVVWTSGAILMLVRYLAATGSTFGLPEVFLGVASFVLATLEGILAVAFYNLVPWSYTVVKMLLPLHRGATMFGVTAKIDIPSVRHVFGKS